MNSVFFVTGSSRGLGRKVARLVLTVAGLAYLVFAMLRPERF